MHKTNEAANFQFKLVHRRLATNSFLYKIGVKDTDKCSFCIYETECLIHLFWDYTIINEFWNRYLNRHSYNAAEKNSKTVTVHQQDA